MSQLSRGALYYLFFLVSTAFLFVWETLVLIVQNSSTALPVMAVVFIMVAILVVMTIFTEVFVIISYYILELLYLVINGIVIQVLNAFRLFMAFLIPALGTVGEGIVVTALGFWNAFCPDGGLLDCIGLDRIIFFIQDFFRVQITVLQILITTVKVWAALIYEFICRMSVYDPGLEQYFCVEQTAYHWSSVRSNLDNVTTTYLSDQVVEDLMAVGAVFGNALKWILGPFINALVRVWLFLNAETLILLKYAVIASAVVLSLFLTILIGIIYSVHPVDVQVATNLDTPTFEETFDLYASRFTEQLLAIDALALWRDADFPCPPGLCPALESVLNTTETTLQTIYEYVPDTILWVDVFVCSVLNVGACGAEFGVCDRLFSEEKGLIYALIEEYQIVLIIMVYAVGGFSLVFLALSAFVAEQIRNSASTEILLRPANDLCLTLLDNGQCQCFLCPLANDNRVTDALGLGPTNGGTCNLANPDGEFCCLGGNNFSIWTQTCEFTTTRQYISMLIFIWKVVSPEAGSLTAWAAEKPPRCEYLDGFVYQFMNYELERYWLTYFDPPYEELFDAEDTINVPYMDSDPQNPTLVNGYPTFVDAFGYNMIPERRSREMTREYMLRTEFDFRTETGLEARTAYRQTLRSLLTGCVGPDYLSYSPHAQVFFQQFNPGAIASTIGQYALLHGRKFRPSVDSDVDMVASIPSNYDPAWAPFFASEYPALPFPFMRDPIAYGSGIMSPVPEHLPIYCNAYLKAEERGMDGGDFWELGGLHHYTVAMSFARSLREVYLSDYLATVGGITYARYAAKKTFTGAPDALRPSIFMDLVAKNRTDFLHNITGYPFSPAAEAAITALPNIAYPSASFVDVCGYTTTETWRKEYGYPSNTNPAPEVHPEFAGYDDGVDGPVNHVFPDSLRFSFNHYYLIDPRFDGYPSYTDWDEQIFKGTSNIIFGCSRLTGDNSMDNATYQDVFYGMMADPSIPLEEAVEYMFTHHHETISYQGWPDAFGTDDDFEYAIKHYLVVRVMKERYFGPLYMRRAIDEFLLTDPCTNLANADVDYLGADVYTMVACNNEKNFLLKNFLKHVIRSDGDGYYKLFATVEPHPTYIATRDAAISELLFAALKFGLATPPVFPRYLDMILPGPGYVPTHLAQQLTYNYIAYFSNKTNYEWFQQDFDLYEALTFCTSSADEPVAFWAGMGLPKTECFLYMNALANDPAFAQTFFHGASTNVDIVKDFVDNVYDYPGRVGTLDYTILNQYVDPTEVTMRNIVDP